MQQPLRLIDQVRVASPCHMKWEDMTGDERKRFCGLCRLNVFNISDMTDDEAEGFIRQETPGRRCVCYFQRSDGTILTKDCKSGAQTQRRPFLIAASITVLTCLASLVVAITKPPEVSPDPSFAAPMTPSIKVKVANVLRRVEAFQGIADQLDPPVMYAGAMAPIATPMPSGKP